MIEENHMVQPYADDEPIAERTEPEFDTEIYYVEKYPKQVSHEFPLDVRIKGLLIEVAETDHMPVGPTIDLLHDVLEHLERSSQTFSTLTGTVDKLITGLESCSMMKRQA